jgi:tetratricopeptide (TPR) repeat protein
MSRVVIERTRRGLPVRFLAVLLVLVFGVGRFVAHAEDRASQIDDWCREALALLEQGQGDAALPLAERAVTQSEKQYGRDDPRLADALNTLAAVYSKLRRYADEQSVRREVERIRLAALPTEQRALIEAVENKEVSADDPRVLAVARGVWPEWRVNAMLANGAHDRPSEMEKFLSRALQLQPPTMPDSDPDRVFLLEQLGYLYQEMGRFSEAEALIKRGLEAHVQAAVTPGDKNAFAGPSGRTPIEERLEALANLYRAMGRPEEAEPLQLQVLRSLEKRYSTDHFTLQNARLNLTIINRELGRVEAPASLSSCDRTLWPGPSQFAQTLQSNGTPLSGYPARIPCARSRAWIEGFSSTHRTTALAGGST